MKSLSSHSILKSAQRLVEGEQQLKETKDPIWISFLKRESNLLLRRTLKVWWQLRFRKYLEVNRS